MVSLSKRRKEARLQSYDGRILTARKYNATIFGMILYGLVANFLICLFCSNMATTVNSVAFFLAYLVCVIVGCIMSAVSTNHVAGFVGYNLIVLPSGFVISVAVQEYGGLGCNVDYCGYDVFRSPEPAVLQQAWQSTVHGTDGAHCG